MLAGDRHRLPGRRERPEPVQHYWSLSVEEQFYVLWPLLIAALAFASRGRRRAAWWGAGLVCVTAGSLAASVLLTESDAAAAYFVTQTRVWELGLGSLLALAVHLGWRLRAPALRAVLAWAGLAAHRVRRRHLRRVDGLPGDRRAGAHAGSRPRPRGGRRRHPVVSGAASRCAPLAAAR